MATIGGKTNTTPLPPQVTALGGGAPKPEGPPGFWVDIGGGQWKPFDHPEAIAFNQGGGGGGGGGGALPPANTGPPPVVDTSAPPQVNATPAFGAQPPQHTPGDFMASGGGGNPMQEAIRNQILGLLRQNPNAISARDPDVAPQADAFTASRERARRQEQSALQERLSTQGLGQSGAADAALAEGFRTAGQDVSQFTADLMGQRLSERRAEVQAALELATEVGLAEQQNMLARELANLDAQLQTLGLGLTEKSLEIQQGIAQLDDATKRYIADLDANLREQGLGVQERLGILDAEVRKFGIETQGRLGDLDIALRRELGHRGLDLGFLEANNAFNLGMSNFGLNSDIAAANFKLVNAGLPGGV